MSGIGFTGSISFRGEDSDEIGIIHSSIIQSGFGLEEGLYSASYQACTSRETAQATFRTFASWLYFDDDLSSEHNTCQVSPDLTYLLDCYQMSLALDSCTIRALEVDGKTDLSSQQLNQGLRCQVSKYRSCLLDAVDTHCKHRSGTPSAEEIERLMCSRM